MLQILTILSKSEADRLDKVLQWLHIFIKLLRLDSASLKLGQHQPSKCFHSSSDHACKLFIEKYPRNMENESLIFESVSFNILIFKP